MNNLPLITLCGLVILTFATSQVASQASNPAVPWRWSVFNYPDPQSRNQTEQRLCGRYALSSICDPNGVISRTDADAIDNLINAVYRETRCQCVHCTQDRHGYIIRVAIMPQIERVFPGGENTTMGMLRDAQMYSYILSQRWRMEGACNETLLILYAKYDGILYTLTRQLTKLKLSNNDVKTISMAVRHYFDDPNTIADGLIEMINRYRLVFDDKHEEALQPSITPNRGNRG